MREGWRISDGETVRTARFMGSIVTAQQPSASKTIFTCSNVLRRRSAVLKKPCVLM